MSESDRGNPIQAALVVLLLVGGGWYFLRHYEIDGLDEVSISPKGELEESTFIAYHQEPMILGTPPAVRRCDRIHRNRESVYVDAEHGSEQGRSCQPDSPCSRQLERGFLGP